MKKLRKVFFGLLFGFLISSCSVQQFSVNTETEPFQNGGKVFGERMKGKVFIKDSDIHLLGVNIKHSNVDQMKNELNTDSYTIETKTSLWLQFLTGGIVAHKTVKVIKRDR